MFGKYESERERIDALAVDDPDLRWNPPGNRWRHERDSLVNRVTAALQRADLVGYHGARLHDDERRAIGTTGLHPLSGDMARTRILRRRDAGDIPEALAADLIKSNQAERPSRRGKVWFINNRSVLTSAGDFLRLFRTWGGEALYWGRESEDQSLVLRKIGQPCIIVAALPIARYQLGLQIGEYFYSAFMLAHGIQSEHGGSCGGHMTEVVPAARILDVIPFSDARFEEITHCSGWAQQIG